MANPHRNRPHLVLVNRAVAEPFKSHHQGGPKALPLRDRNEHSETLKKALASALASAMKLRPQAGGTAGGVYLDFKFPAGSEQAVEKLESRGIELVAVREDASGGVIATAFVPNAAKIQLKKKIDQYQQEDTKPKSKDPLKAPPPAKPRNQELIARIEEISASWIRSLFTGDANDFPSSDETIWWEVWSRREIAPLTKASIVDAGLLASEARLDFPDRSVQLVYGNTQSLSRLFVNSDHLAEIRRAQDTPATFTEWNNHEQAMWAKDALDRLAQFPGDDLAITLLDTGVNRGHPMLTPIIGATDVHKYHPDWTDGDSSTHGHGTGMAGLIAYGDLTSILTATGPIEITHRVESVKILTGPWANTPDLYGAITRESVARVEVEAPWRRRAICMAVTSAYQSRQGRPSSWSAAVDQLCFGDDTASRLLLISAGNIREPAPNEYPDRNDIESIESPGQAWNALTIGAYTEKVDVVDPTFKGYKAIAPVGDLSPTSRTSVSWKNPWPLKPDIVLEGGNLVTDEVLVDSPDELGLLTTHRDPSSRHFDIMRETSAATALAGNLVGRIMAAQPQRRPETIRGLIVHSAEWTPAMQQHLKSAKGEMARVAFVRRYGYGVPSYSRAVFSAVDDLTLICEETLHPLKKVSGQIQFGDMKLHNLPWPKAALEELGPAEVELRVTLSYFVEPNPGERGWSNKHRYASHQFRFAIKRPEESPKAFRARINKVAAEEEGELGTNGKDEGWTLGRIRDRGSIHSDSWRGTAVDLASRGVIAVYPVGGWWKTNPRHQRHDRACRYSLIVSLRVPSGVDIYTPVCSQIAVAIEGD